MFLHKLIEQHWQRPYWFLTIILWPCSYLFRLLTLVRHLYYHYIAKPQAYPIPIIVIGNIHVGGTGKTPITASLVSQLQQKGIKVGIISRGYGRKSKAIHIINSNSTPYDAGDEPLLLYRKTHAPMVVASDRQQAAHTLLQYYPDLQMIISDDGLQHYRLHRDIEIAVFPANDLNCQLYLLPQGKLREPRSRLNSVNAIILSQSDTVHTIPVSIKNKFIFQSYTKTDEPYCFHNPKKKWDFQSMSHNASHVAIAAIANPERFFHSLRNMGIILTECHALPDHASIDHFPQADYIFITEKDAIKLSINNTPKNVWVVPICAIIKPDLSEYILNHISFPS